MKRLTNKLTTPRPRHPTRFWIYAVIAALALFAAFRSMGEENHPPFSEMMGGCDDYKTDLRKEFTAWGAANQTSATAGLSASDIGNPSLSLNEKITLGLSSSGVTVAFPPPAEKLKMYNGKFGGFAKFRAPKSGNYRLSVGAKAWIELLDIHMKPVSAFSFEMQTGCNEIFKVVNFHLKGSKTYYLQVTGSKVENLALLITRTQKI